MRCRAGDFIAIGQLYRRVDWWNNGVPDTEHGPFPDLVEFWHDDCAEDAGLI